MRLAALASRSWLFGAVFGAGLGLVILGVGSRLAMWGIALADGGPGAFTVEGTLTVLLCGVLAGAGSGLLYALLDRFLSWAWARDGAFGILLLLVTLRGLHPVDGTRLLLFLPVVAVFAVTFVVLWRSYAVGNVSAGSVSLT